MKIQFTNVISFLLLSHASLASNLTVTSQVGNGFKLDGQWLTTLHRDNQHLFYTDIASNYSDNRSWSSGLALGYRHLLNTPSWGTYLFADYNHAALNHYYWSLNPGLEFFSQHWDWHLNGYLPLSHKDWLVKQDFANQFADYQHTSFTGHQQYDHIYTERAELAPGLDMSTTWHPGQEQSETITFGAYHFQFKASDKMNGLYLSLEYPINQHFKLVTTDSYDNYLHNFITLGIKFTLVAKASALSPIVRNLANRQQAALLPTASYLVDQGGSYLEKDNIWFFHPSDSNPTTSDYCTAEHPCSNLNQEALAHIHTIAPRATIYLSNGHYPTTQLLHVYTGQTINGRSSDYKQPGNNTQIIGSLDLASDTTLTDIQLLNDPAKHYTTGITINDAERVNLQRVTVGSESQSSGYPIALETEGSQQINIDHSHLIAYMQDEQDTVQEAIGIYSRSSQLTLQDSHVDAYAYTEQGISRANAISALAINPKRLNEIKLINSQLTATAHNTKGLSASNALTIDSLAGPSMINIQHSTLTANAFSNQANANAYAINNHSEEMQQSTFHIENSSLIANSDSKIGQAKAIGINNTSELEAKDSFSISQSHIKAVANSQTNLAEATTISSDPSFDASAYFNINTTEMSAAAISQQGTAKALVISSMPFFQGSNQFTINQSILNAQAHSNDGEAFATIIQTQQSAFLLQNNLFISSVFAEPSKRHATIINNLGDNLIDEKDNQFFILTDDFKKMFAYYSLASKLGSVY